MVLHRLENPEKETNFENCVADVNIPVGEVFTSPVLAGTQGKLHVSKVYLNGLKYLNLEIDFKDGMIADYSCTNFDTPEENRKLSGKTCFTIMIRCPWVNLPSVPTLRRMYLPINTISGISADPDCGEDGASFRRRRYLLFP